MNNYNLYYILLLAAVLGAFAYLWRQGYLVRIKNYFEETREELRKCTWPSWDELKGSTVVVLISVVLLGGFTVAAEIVIARFVEWVMKLSA